MHADIIQENNLTHTTTESYTILLLESSSGNIPSYSWPNHSSDVAKGSSRGCFPSTEKQLNHDTVCVFIVPRSMRPTVWQCRQYLAAPKCHRRQTTYWFCRTNDSKWRSSSVGIMVVTK